MAKRRNYNGAQHNQTPTIVRQAGADIDDVRNRIMKFDENGKVVLATAGTDLPLGIAIIEAGCNDITGVESGMVKAGDDVDILIKDIGVAIAGGAIKAGQEVAAGADGKAVAAAGGDYVFGIALDNAAEGDYFSLQLVKYQKASGATGSGEQMEEEEGTL